MRRGASYGLVVLGVAFLVLAPLVRWVVPGIAAWGPGKINQQLFLRGTGDFWFVTADDAHAVKNVPIQVSRYVTTACKNSDATKSKATTTCPSGEVSDGKVGVWDQRIEYTATLPDKTVKTIQVDLDRVAFDRSNGQAVAGYAQPQNHGNSQVFFFPRNVKKQTYQFWDVADYHAEPASFVRETTYAGLPAYEFKQTPNRDLGNLSSDGTIPGKWLGRPTENSVAAHRIYSNTRLLYVEPKTGTILGESEDSTVLARALDGRGTPLVLLQVHNFQTAPETQKFLADEARTLGHKLHLLTVVLPLAALVVGLLALVAGIVMVARLPRRRPKAGPPPPAGRTSPAPAAASPGS